MGLRPDHVNVAVLIRYDLLYIAMFSVVDLLDASSLLQGWKRPPV